MDELHALLTRLGLLIVYAFLHGVDFFIPILTHHTILDRFRIGNGVALRLELGLSGKLRLGRLGDVLLLLIGSVMIWSWLNLLLLEVVITDVITVILSAQR